MEAKLQALGMIECNSIAAGIEAADYMVKAAQVEVLLLKTICPGKFLVGIHGEVAAIQSSVEAGLAYGKEAVVDHFVVANISPAVISAMACSVESPRGSAIGVIETFSAATCVHAADTAFKAADVDLIEVRVAMGLGGKAYCLLSGDVASVESAIAAGSVVASDKGLLVRRLVIPSLAPQVLKHLM